MMLILEQENEVSTECQQLHPCDKMTFATELRVINRQTFSVASGLNNGFRTRSQTCQKDSKGAPDSNAHGLCIPSMKACRTLPGTPGPSVAFQSLNCP